MQNSFIFFKQKISLISNLKRFKIAADKGNDINAQAAVGVCYKDAIGVQRDVSLAEKYLSMAADRGDSKSQVHSFFAIPFLLFSIL